MLAFCAAQLAATFIAVYSDWGFTSIEPCGWGWAAVVWVWDVAWFLPLDGIKLAARWAFESSSSSSSSEDDDGDSAAHHQQQQQPPLPLPLTVGGGGGGGASVEIAGVAGASSVELTETREQPRSLAPAPVTADAAGVRPIDNRGWFKRIEDASWSFYLSTKSVFTHHTVGRVIAVTTTISTLCSSPTYFGNESIVCTSRIPL